MEYERDLDFAGGDPRGTALAIDRDRQRTLGTVEALGDGGMEYRLDDPDDRALWNQTWTEVKAS